MSGSITRMKDAGAYFDASEALKPTALTTASGALTGPPVDRRNYLGGSLVVNFAAAQSKVKTSTITVKVQHSDTTATSTFVDYKFQDKTTAGTVTLHSTATVTPSVVAKFNLNLMSAKKYIRFSGTAALPTGSTVTLAGPASAVFVFGGKHDL
jgi:hypothetical protein